MIKNGRKLTKASVSHYTNSHESDETKEEFRSRYGPAQMLYSLTLPVWVSIPLSKATEEALKNCSDALLAGGFQSTDLEATEHNQDPTIKIHEPMPMNFSGHSSLSAFLTSLKSVRNDSPIS